MYGRCIVVLLMILLYVTLAQEIASCVNFEGQKSLMISMFVKVKKSTNRYFRDQWLYDASLYGSLRFR